MVLYQNKPRAEQSQMLQAYQVEQMLNVLVYHVLMGLRYPERLCQHPSLHRVLAYAYELVEAPDSLA